MPDDPQIQQLGVDGEWYISNSIGYIGPYNSKEECIKVIESGEFQAQIDDYLRFNAEKLSKEQKKGGPNAG